MSVGIGSFVQCVKKKYLRLVIGEKKLHFCLPVYFENTYSGKIHSCTYNMCHKGVIRKGRL